MELTQHPLSAAFPPMSATEYDALCKSVAEIGLLNPIVLFEGMVIDGWHRYCACHDEMVLAPTVNLASDIDPQSYVIAQNKDRRHLTQSQLATAAIKVYEWLKNGVNSGLQAASAPSAEPKSSKEIAVLAGVSTKTIDEAKKVEKQATPEVKEAVAKGEISVSKAVKDMAKEKPQQFSDDDYTPTDAELKEAIEEEDAENAKKLAKQVLIESLIDSDDPFAELSKNFIQVEALNHVLNSRNNGLMNENAALGRVIKARDSQIAKLKKELAAK